MYTEYRGGLIRYDECESATSMDSDLHRASRLIAPAIGPNFNSSSSERPLRDVGSIEGQDMLCTPQVQYPIVDICI